MRLASLRVPFVAACALLFSCVDPVCGCTPLVPGAVISGSLRTEADAPQPGKRIHFETAVGSCANYIRSHDTTVTDSLGQFRMWAYLPTVEFVCVRWFAQDTTAGAVERRLGGPASIAGGTYDHDTITVALTLPP